MASGASASTYKLLRDLWPQKSIYEAVYQVDPLIGMIPKDTTFYEPTRHIDVGDGLPQGVGPDFTTAKAFKSASLADEFLIKPVTYYGLLSIEGRLMRMSKGDKAVIVKPLARESKNVITQWKRDFSAYVHGNGGGALGQISAISGNTITVVNGATVTAGGVSGSRMRAFQRNMPIWTGSGDGTTGVLRTIVAAPLVTQVDPVNGILYLSAPVASVLPDTVVGDYLFRAGVFGNVVAGFDAWIPVHNGNPGPLFGVTRNTEPYKLAGVAANYAGQGKSIREVCINHAALVYDNGGMPDTQLLNSQDWVNLQLELISAGALIQTTTTAASIGKYNFGMKYDAISLQGPSGEIKVYACPDAPQGKLRTLTLDTWTLASTGDLVSFIDGASPDNMMMEDQADSFEARLVGDYQMYTEAPNQNGSASF